MRVGFERGYRMVEFDVKLAADGVAFLLHDDTLDRTTNVRGPADALAWAKLSELDAGSWHSRAYAGERIPTFASVAQWAIANGVACNVEIKPMPGKERPTGTAVAHEAQELWRNAPVPPLLSSFSEEALSAARDATPELPRALLLEKIPADWLERLSRLGCAAIDLDYRELTAERVRAAREAGYKVMTYTPNDPRVVAKLMDWGVDTVITDAIDVIPPG
jgi:glycerophosphoryl diester phosphodiesterase